ncbi:MAG: aminotransferase class IV [Gammaproteobacteria bacterium]|nr:aminotransferase class IV [Gammaproteobacteria bacterium]
MSGVQRWVWRDGEFVRWEDATVHILAQSLQRGSLAFDYMSVHEARRGTAVFRLADHVDRLFRTCDLMGLPIAYTREELIEGCAAAVRRNPGSKSLKISALIPSIEAELVPQDPRVGVFICAYDVVADVIEQHGGTPRWGNALSLKVERDITNRRPDIIPPQVKIAANYTSAMFAKWRARQEGYDEIVLLDTDGYVAEAPTSNIFVVGPEGLVTPPEQKVLHGITRASILELAGALGVGSTVRDLTVDDLHAAAEVFLTATSVGVWPVVRIDGHEVGDGAPGAVTEGLRAAFARIRRGEDAKFEHWLYYV